MKTMRPQRAMLPLAFLSAGFVLGCEDSRPTPVGPEGLGPLFHVSAKHPDGHGGGGGEADNPGSPFYKYTFTGDIMTDPSTADAKPTVGNDQNGEVVLQHCCDNPGVVEALILSSALVDQFDANELCFPREDNGTVRFDSFGGELRPDKKDMNKVVAFFLFTAQDKSGMSEVRYRLTFDGNVDVATNMDLIDGIFPPEPEETTIVTFTDLASIGAQQKKEKNACSGVTSINSSVRVLGTNTEPPPL